MQFRAVGNLALISAVAISAPALSWKPMQSQQIVRGAENTFIKPTPLAASARTAVPALIPYSGTGAGADGKLISGEVPVTFLIYKEETGGEPLFTESQAAFFDADGHYEVKLGATLSNGIPIDLFGSGAARWLEVQIAGAKVAPRVLLASVPYAMKSGDASTLGGLPASAYALAGTGQPPATNSIKPEGTGPSFTANVTTTGGTSGYLPVFNGGATLVDSILFQSSTGIGVGDMPNSAYKLDVNGPSILRGVANLSSNGSATSSAGTDSYPLSFSASAYNSTTKANATPTFYWQAEPAGNNTSAPGATLNLLYNSNYGSGAVIETGLHLNSNGTIQFATGQTFSANNPNGLGVEGTSSYSFGVEGNSIGSAGVEGQSTNGAGVQGNSTSGNGVNGTSIFANGMKGITEGLNSHTAGVLGVAGTGNTSGFTGIAGTWGDSNAQVGILGTSTQSSGVQGMSATTYGVQGSTTGAVAVAGPGYADAAAGVYGNSSSNAPGVVGQSTLGDGGDFIGALNGITASGDNPAPNAPGTGGNFQGGVTVTDGIPGGAAVYAQGGDDASPDGQLPKPGNFGGVGVTGTGGYSYNGGNGGDGGYFTGGGSDYAASGYGIYAVGGDTGDLMATKGPSAMLDGDVYINGTLNADLKNFQIDHPLDPANKYLNHASIESSEMVDLYSGNVVTDAQGFSTVQLPSWFETLNGDLRYQLTTIGRKAQAWISEEVKDGTFQIASDTGGVKVSWLITAVRQDAYAKAHPLVVEQQKGAHEIGFYKHPELYGQPAQKSLEWGRNPQRMRTTQLAAEKHAQLVRKIK